MNDKISLSEVRLIFEENFNKSYRVIKSPGRINIIGEHLDYHEGFVMPAAIDKFVYFAFQKNTHQQCHFVALNLNKHFKPHLGNARNIPDEVWHKYVMSIMYILQDKGYEIGGINCVFGGDVPVGSGMSSSAAITCGLMAMWNEAFDLKLSKKECILYAQEAEHKYVGVMCGIMDQFANTFGEEQSIIKLDCRNLQYELIPFNYPDFCFLLLNTGVKHTHAGGAYNRIRQQCLASIPFFQKLDSSVLSLRDVTMDMLAAIKTDFSDDTHSKIKYVIEEIDRVKAAANNLANDDINALGILMYQTHFGLQNDYGVSCDELDFLVERTLDMDQVLGSRMMGGGFGGCTINLVPSIDAEAIGQELLNAYSLEYPHKTDAYIARISGGTHIVD